MRAAQTTGAARAATLALLLAPASASAAGTITGLVADRSGSGVAGAEIRVHAAAETGGPGPAAALADAGGRFALEVASPGPWILWASAPGYLDGRAGPISVSGPDAAATAAIRLFRAGLGSMSGTVKDPGGSPIEGVRVEITQPTYALGTPVVRTTDAEGRYRFEAVTVGRVEFRFELGGSEAVSPVEGTGGSAVKEGEDLVRDVVFPRPDQAIEGIALYEDGRPLARGKAVFLFRPTFQERFAFRGGETPTDEAGRFRMENLVPGDYRVFFSGSPPDGGGPERFLGDVAGVRPGGGPIEFRVTSPLPVLVTGKVVNLDAARGQAGSKVTVEVAGTEQAADVSDLDGKFAFGARLSETLPNIVKAVHRSRGGADERWLDPAEIRADGSLPEVVFTVTRQPLGGDSK